MMFPTSRANIAMRLSIDRMTEAFADVPRYRRFSADPA
ncbi:hypothetical protein XFLM_05730 [Xylella fastidiosa subsp. fastidiosa GB514]|nr:hypothetical protein XFLM_05730 [Xylella fastidiosa subsp. fastidiosa GB514]KAF0570471.1 hypothetical protein P305_09845 [Xylella fastidiosa subsp. fastidiosa Mus-1]